MVASNDALARGLDPYGPEARDYFDRPHVGAVELAAHWLRTPGRDARVSGALAALVGGGGMLVLTEVLSGLAAEFPLPARRRCDERAARSVEPPCDGLRIKRAVRRLA